MRAHTKLYGRGEDPTGFGPLDHKHQPDENDEVAVRNSSDISEGEMNLNIFALGALDTL